MDITKTRPGGIAGTRLASVVTKGADGRPDPFTPSPAEVAQINQLTLRDFSAEELWVCTIRGCDNQPDRHYERLLPDALKKLAGTFAGRTQLQDHRWSSMTQNARLFAAEVVVDPSESSEVVGEAYTCLNFQLYMVRTEANADMRLNIEAGILKETSVGFFLDWYAVQCSICGGAIYDWQGKCSHWPGDEYDGETCLGLIPAHDALEGAENSWVAVPAQPRAGAVRSQKDAEGEALRQELKARKEHAVKGAELLALLKDPTKLAEALKDLPEADTAAVLAKLNAATAEDPASAEPTLIDHKAYEAQVQAWATEAAKAATAPITEAVEKLTALADSLEKGMGELTKKFESRLAPVGDGPLFNGFGEGDPAQNAAPANPAPAPSVGQSLASALLADLA